MPASRLLRHTTRAPCPRAPRWRWAFAAARAAGIHNVVWASSETVLELSFDEPPPYAPGDEAYYPRPNSSYYLK
jgi:hypothetical protein